MEKNPTWLCVVALALRDGSGRWLMHRRPPGKQHAGRWEFPGGKVENGETPSAALVREIAEETGLKVEASHLRPVGFAQELFAEGRLPSVILLYTSVWDGSRLFPHEGGELVWFEAEQINSLDKPPLDMALAAQLFEKVLA